MDILGKNSKVEGVKNREWICGGNVESIHSGIDIMQVVELTYACLQGVVIVFFFACHFLSSFATDCT